ncbi:MAG: sigma-70 family RNA polymerase sigma factor [Bacteroidota bacterium]
MHTTSYAQVSVKSPSYQVHSYLSELSDEDLMKQFTQGTLEAFNLIVDRYALRLTRYLTRYVKDADRCQDLVQETFIRLYRNRFSYKPVARFSTWLFTIATNLARSDYRRRKIRRFVSLSETPDESDRAPFYLPDPDAAPDRDASEQLLMDRVNKAINKLSEKYREVIVLREVQQLTYEEIAQITGLPMGTVKSRLNRARTRLSSVLDDMNLAYTP